MQISGLKTPSTQYLGHSDLDMKIHDFTNFSSTKFNVRDCTKFMELFYCFLLFFAFQVVAAVNLYKPPQVQVYLNSA